MKRRLFLVFAIVMASLSGLLAVSALVPDVGCAGQPNNFLETYTSISLFAPETVDPGQSFSVNGTLYKNLGPGPLTVREPFPQQEISFEFAGSTTTLITDSSGNFTTELSINKPGVHRMVAYYAGDRLLYYVESGAERYITVTGPPAKPVDYRWLIYITIAAVVLVIGYIIYGRIKEYRRSRVANEVDWGSLTRSHRKKPGRLRLWLTGLLAAVIIGGIFFALWPRAQAPFAHGTKPELVETRITLKAPERVNPEQAFAISGTLVTIEDGKELPFPTRPVRIVMSPRLGSTTELTMLETDDNGAFAGEIVLEKTGVFEIAAVFDDTCELYYESSDARNIIVGSLPVSPFSDWTQPGWLSLIIGVPLATLTAIAIVLYYRRWRKRPAKDKSDKKLAAGSTPTPVILDTPEVYHDPSLRIDFPQITRNFPDVWGRGDELRIIVHKVTDDGPTRVHIKMEQELNREADFDADGMASQEYTYTTSGEYEIKAFSSKRRNGYRPASRTLRIVDYRAEIVRLYNEMVETLQAGGLKLPPEMTAREVEYRLRRGFPKLPTNATNALVATFEEANYSLHPITRPAYEKMFLAVGQVRRYVNA